MTGQRLILALFIATAMAATAGAQLQARPPSVFPPQATPLFLSAERGDVATHQEELLLLPDPPAAQSTTQFVAPGVTLLNVVNQPNQEDWFTDDVWEKDMEVTDAATAILYFQANAQATTVFEVRLLSVHPDGAVEVLAQDSQQFVTALSATPVTFFLNAQGFVLREGTHLQLQVFAQTGNAVIMLQYGGDTPSGVGDFRVRWLDSDGDGVSDSDERAEGTNPLSPMDFLEVIRDSDRDGLPDSWESTIGSDPSLADTDGDGFGDGVEVYAGSDPLDPASTPRDDNGNGLPDTFENNYFNNTTINQPGGVDPGADPDGDGCDNLCEAAHGTNPNDADTDDDGVPDGQEIGAGTDPNDRAGGRDADNDGLTDDFERALGTDPADRDSDDDGFLDGVEVFAGSNPRDAASTPVDADRDGLPDKFETRYFNNITNVLPGDDPDGDGCDNLCEAAHGTDPTNADSDGDGTDDGDEIDLGSDPKERADAPTRAADRAELQTGAGLFALASILSLFGISRWKP